MFTRPDTYHSVENIRGVDIYIPEYGMGVDADYEDIVVDVEVIKRSEDIEQQYWQREEMPREFMDWVDDEKEKQQTDPTYFNFDLEKIRQREWHRRIYGIWVWIKGVPYYLPGSYYFFLSHWVLDGGYPVFRKSDYKKSLYWKWNEYNPLSYGMIEVTKRRGGKSVFAACMVTEYTTRTMKAICNMQSKSEDDAKKLFDYHIVTPFQALSPIFIPVYDTNKGTKPEKKLSFYAASARGKNAVANDEQIKSEISFEDSKPLKLDGQKLARAIFDERGKVDFDLIDAHLIVRKCFLDWRMNIVGKMIVTTTVEEIGMRSRFFDLWKDSNPENLFDDSTKSGLYSFFMPADEAGDCDIYGDALIEKNRKVIARNRANLEGDQKALMAEIRKDPLSEREAFMMLNDNCHFNAPLLNEMYQDAEIAKNMAVEYGNYYWKDGVPFSESLWETCDKSNARWSRAKGFKVAEGDKVAWCGNMAKPLNTIQYIMGGDPFQNDITENTLNSKASAGVLNRVDPGENDQHFNRFFVSKYHFRQPMAKLYHMDMVLMCFHFGCQFLVEAKMDGGLRKFFKDNGLDRFLVYLPDKVNAGIDPNQDNKVLLVNCWEEWINTQGKQGKMIYPDVIDDEKDGLLKFNINNTEASNQVMGLGWTLVADYFMKANFRKNKKQMGIMEIFPMRKIA
jgi:hypothetical protein